MNIMIVGCGKVGRQLAVQLNEKGNELIVLDIDPERAESTAVLCDGQPFTGNGASYAVLRNAGVESCDLVIAATGSDEQNLLCCLLARQSGCQTIARVRNPEYNADLDYFKNQLNLSLIINPEYAAAEEIARVLRFPSALEIDTFAGGKLELVKFKLRDDSPLIGMEVRQMGSRFRSDVLVCTVERGDSVVIATGSTDFRAGDVVSVIAQEKDAYTFFRKIGAKAKQVHDVMIVGGGNITHYLCQLLADTGISITVIEKNKARADELDSDFRKVDVRHADAVSQSALLELGVESAEAFVALTNIDEENILLSLYARSVSNAKIVTKINRIDFDDVIDGLNLGTVVYPKNLISEQIVRFVRASRNATDTNLETLYQILNGKAEAAMFIVKKEGELTGSTLAELPLKSGVLIAAIIRDGKPFLPRGNDRIRKEDAVIVVTTQLGLHDMKDVLRGH